MGDSGRADEEEVWAVILAAGTGMRFGGVKQFASLDGRRLVDVVVETAASVCDEVVVVLPVGVKWDGSPVAAVTEGGPTREASVRRGLAAVPSRAGLVVVHDAAHPLASPTLFEAVIAAVKAGADGAVPGLRLTETLKRVDGGRSVANVDRRDLVMVQTPHAFRAAALRTAHAKGGEATDDSVLVEAVGGVVAVVPGDPRNIHVTTAGELEVARGLAMPGG
jgi:2-C-methyl-D-erythritol 4-phosphate cytidylyltransferase